MDAAPVDGPLGLSAPLVIHALITFNTRFQTCQMGMPGLKLKPALTWPSCLIRRDNTEDAETDSFNPLTMLLMI